MLLKRKAIKLIINDVESRKGFDVVNIMQRHYGFPCLLSASKDYGFQMPLVYGEAVAKLRSLDYPTFAADLEALLASNTDSTLVYLPVSEKPTRFLYRYMRGRPVPNFKFLLPSEHNFNLCSDKFQFQQFCEQEGFPVPRSYQLDDLPALRAAFRPLVLKPRVGQGSVGLRYLSEPADLEQLETIDWSAYLLQDRIASRQQVAGAFFLCLQGEVVNAYTHQRLRTFPPEGGVTVYSQSTYTEEIIEIGSRLLRKLNWEGLAMIEFMYDEGSQSWRIIELNPRLWGSVMLSAFNRSEMLRQYVEASLGEKLDPRPELRNHFIRWYYPFELLNWMKGAISLKTLLKLDAGHTCYVNFTYSSIYRSVAYFIYFTFNFSSIRRFLKKLGG